MIEIKIEIKGLDALTAAIVKVGENLAYPMQKMAVVQPEPGPSVPPVADQTTKRGRPKKEPEPIQGPPLEQTAPAPVPAPTKMVLDPSIGEPLPPWEDPTPSILDDDPNLPKTNMELKLLAQKIAKAMVTKNLPTEELTKFTRDMVFPRFGPQTRTFADVPANKVADAGRDFLKFAKERGLDVK